MVAIGPLIARVAVVAAAPLASSVTTSDTRGVEPLRFAGGAHASTLVSFPIDQVHTPTAVTGISLKFETSATPTPTPSRAHFGSLPLIPVGGKLPDSPSSKMDLHAPEVSEKAKHHQGHKNNTPKDNKDLGGEQGLVHELKGLIPGNLSPVGARDNDQILHDVKEETSKDSSITGSIAGGDNSLGANQVLKELRLKSSSLGSDSSGLKRRAIDSGKIGRAQKTSDENVSGIIGDVETLPNGILGDGSDDEKVHSQNHKKEHEHDHKVHEHKKQHESTRRDLPIDNEGGNPSTNLENIVQDDILDQLTAIPGLVEELSTADGSSGTFKRGEMSTDVLNNLKQNDLDEIIDDVDGGLPDLRNPNEVKREYRGSGKNSGSLVSGLVAGAERIPSEILGDDGQHKHAHGQQKKHHDKKQHKHHDKHGHKLVA